jgi:hypothetical protein
MSFDYDRLEKKKSELELKFARLLVTEGLSQQDSESIAKEFLTHTMRITPPEKESGFLELIQATSLSGAGGGRSSKLGNISLNLDKLFGGLVGSSLVISSLSSPIASWTLVSFCLSIRGITQVSVSENDVGVLWTLWKMRDDEGIVHEPEDEILIATNDHLNKYGRNPIGKADIKAALAHLTEIRSITPKAEGGWFVAERVNALYR